MRPVNGALCGTPFLLFAVLKLVEVGGGVEGVKLGMVVFPLFPWDESESDADSSPDLFLPFFVVPAI